LNRTARFLTLALGAVLVAGEPIAAARTRPTWDPATTHALLIGVLAWKHPGLGSFPTAGRVDRILEKTLVARGVPVEHVTFLEDTHATLAACRAALDATVKAVPPDGTLLVYYAGHGLREQATTYLAPYDTDTKDTAATGLGVAEIGTTLHASFKGAKLILLADCCHSGALGEIVRSYDSDPRVSAASFTSSEAASTSTGRWTFTESVVAALSGGGAADTDRDDVLDAGELDDFVHREMRYRESQWVRGARTPSFPKDLAHAPDLSYHQGL